MQGEFLTIGRVAREVGVPVETLRTWERRYGFPKPIRRPSGHRRFCRDTVGRLKLAKQALERGVPASEALSAEPEALRAVLRGCGEADERVRSWIAASLTLDGIALEDALEDAWRAWEPLAFATELAAPFIRDLGDMWVRGEIGVLHEHFATEILRAFLARKWRRLSIGSEGPSVVCATLPGEQHTLGLHLATLAAVLAGARPVFLGRSTPLEDVLAASEQVSAAAVLVGLSPASEEGGTRRQLAALRRALPDSVVVIAGGRQLEVEGVHLVTDLAALDAEIRALETPG